MIMFYSDFGQDFKFMILEETAAATTLRSHTEKERQMQNVAPRCPCSDQLLSAAVLGQRSPRSGPQVSLDQYTIPIGIKCKSGRGPGGCGKHLGEQ